jgi:predicted HicB family RNase H-like nuclease
MKETVEIRLPKKLLYKLMMMAHEQDITLNQLIENVLVKTIKEHKENRIKCQ